MKKMRAPYRWASSGAWGCLGGLVGTMLSKRGPQGESCNLELKKEIFHRSQHYPIFHPKTWRFFLRESMAADGRCRPHFHGSLVLGRPLSHEFQWQSNLTGISDAELNWVVVLPCTHVFVYAMFIPLPSCKKR